MRQQSTGEAEAARVSSPGGAEAHVFSPGGATRSRFPPLGGDTPLAVGDARSAEPTVCGGFEPKP
jgi:hypothetical protein